MASGQLPLGLPSPWPLRSSACPVFGRSGARFAHLCRSGSLPLGNQLPNVLSLQLFSYSALGYPSGVRSPLSSARSLKPLASSPLVLGSLSPVTLSPFAFFLALSSVCLFVCVRSVCMCVCHSAITHRFHVPFAARCLAALAPTKSNARPVWRFLPIDSSDDTPFSRSASPVLCRCRSAPSDDRPPSDRPL